MPTNVLFLCPHNAAKSITAAAYLGRIAAANNLDVAIDTAGTDPDEHILTLVRDRLLADGYMVEGVPRLVNSEDLETADHIINMGCPHESLPTTNSVQDWSIPNFSEDPSAAFAAIAEHVEQLAKSL